MYKYSLHRVSFQLALTLLATFFFAQIANAVTQYPSTASIQPGDITSTMILDATIIGRDISTNAGLRIANFSIASTTPTGLLAIEMGTTTPAFFVGDTGTTTPFFIINGSGNIGIGTTTPGSIFSIDRVAQFVQGISATSTFYTDLTFRSLLATSTIYLADGTSLVPGLSFSTDTNMGLFRVGENILGFTTGGIERARINAVGNLGIGTTTPAALFSVQNGSLLSGTSTIGSIIATSTFSVNGPRGDRFSILESGFVAIGTSSPTSLLSVQGNALISGTTTAGALEATSTLRLRGVSYSPPAADGSTNQALTTNGSGGLSWATLGAGYTRTAGQDLIAGDPIFPARSGTTTTTHTQDASNAGLDLNPSASTRIAQSLYASSPFLISEVIIREGKNGTPLGDLVVAIVPDVNGLPDDGFIIASSSKTAASLPSAGTNITFGFYPSVFIPDGTRVWIVVYDAISGDDIGANYSIQYQNTDVNVVGNLATKAGTWTNLATQDLRFILTNRAATTGNVYLATAAFTKVASTTIGIVSASYSTSSTATIYGTGQVISGLPTRTIGSTTYLGVNPRAFPATPSLATRALGIMIDVGTLLIDLMF